MKAAIATTALILTTLSGAASANIFILGDVTPVYSLTTIPPHQNVVEGNQELFRRVLGEPVDARVTIVAGEEFPSWTTFELSAFFNYEGVVVDEVTAFAVDSLTRTTLLVLGMPDWAWASDELDLISTFLSNGGRMLVLVEPGDCAAACYENTDTLFRALGSNLKIAEWKSGDETSGGYRWGLLADHELMRGMNPITYGATLTIEGGTPLMYEARGESMFSTDESIGEGKRHNSQSAELHLMPGD